VVIHGIQLNVRLFQRQHHDHGDERQYRNQQTHAANNKTGFCGAFIPLNHLLLKGAGFSN
jgi:hypothetical protein